MSLIVPTSAHRAPIRRGFLPCSREYVPQFTPRARMISERMACSKEENGHRIKRVTHPEITAVADFEPITDSEIIQKMPDMVCVATWSGVVVRTNSAVKKIMGKDGLGENLITFLRPDSAGVVLQNIMQLWDPDKPAKYVESRAIGVTTDGREIPLWYRGTLVHGPKGELYMVGIIRDITDLVAQEEKSYRTNLLAKRYAPPLLAELSEGFNQGLRRLMQPLNIAREDILKPAFLENVRGGDEADALRYLHRIAAGAEDWYKKGMEKLSYCLYVMEHLESVLAGKEEEPKVEKHTLERWVRGFLAQHGNFSTEVYLARYSKDHIEFNFNYKAGKLGDAYIDPSALDLILQDLITNAIQYNRKDKVSVTLEAKRSKDQKEIIFTITDDGPGIPKPLIGTGGRSLQTTHLESGMDDYGITLLVARQTVEKHGGRLFIRNLERGGAEVTVHIPVVHPMAGEVVDL